MRVLHKIGFVILVIAVVIGSIATYAPALFFKIPNVGYILWAMTGGAMPPFIITGPFDSGNNDWLKDGDVVVSAAAKSGTTWMLFCSHQIRTKGNDEKHPFADVSLSTPWPEFIQTPGESWETHQREKMNTTILPDGTSLKDYWDHKDYPFRIFKSHNHPDQFGDLIGNGGKGKKIKFLAMARNGLDQVASMTPFFNGHIDEFRTLWGGFPPLTTWRTTREDAAERMEQLKPGGTLANLSFPYVNKWWKVKDDENVLLIHYADAKADLSGTVSKLAEFYGVELTTKEHTAIVEKCGLKYMKRHEHMFGYTLPLNTNFKKSIMKTGSLIRKGENGDGKDLFTDEQKETWRLLEEELYGDDPRKLEWARHGSKL